MRKYLAAAALGAMLIAGQAAATDSAVVNADDRIGAQSATSDDLQGVGLPLILIAGGLFVSLVALGFSNHGGGKPASP